VSEVVLAVIVVRNVLARVFSRDLEWRKDLGSSLGIRSNKSKARLGTVSQAFEEGDDKVLDIRVLFSPHIDGSFLEKRFLLGVHQSPHDSVSPEFRILLTVKEDGEEVIAKSKFVSSKEGLESSHGSITNGTVLVLVGGNSQQNFSSNWEVDVPEGNDGLGLFFESGGSGDSVREDLDVFLQKSRLLAAITLASTSN